MTKTFIRSTHRATLWTTSLCLLILALIATACGDSGSPATSSPSSNAASSGNVTIVTITEQAGGHDIYGFAPQTVAIKAGTSIKWVNNSDENHKLIITPSGPTAGTVPRSGSNDNTLMVTFPTAGTFTITSQLVDRLKDGQHTPDPADSHAMLTVTVN
ncbi:MAG TPA: hypothetical protein VKY19_10395 [Ktedonosporobacter sp.]|nr:hypothetical protein [Ktedonosporobacter sp.]